MVQSRVLPAHDAAAYRRVIRASCCMLRVLYDIIKQYALLPVMQQAMAG